MAIAYVMQKTPYVFPIIGGRKIEHLMSNIEALKISLDEEQMKEIEGVVPFDLGFPHHIIVCVSLLFRPIADSHFKGTGYSDTIFVLSAGIVDKQPLLQPIRPAN